MTNKPKQIKICMKIRLQEADLVGESPSLFSLRLSGKHCKKYLGRIDPRSLDTHCLKHYSFQLQPSILCPLSQRSPDDLEYVRHVAMVTLWSPGCSFCFFWGVYERGSDLKLTTSSTYSLGVQEIMAESYLAGVTALLTQQHILSLCTTRGLKPYVLYEHRFYLLLW